MPIRYGKRQLRLLIPWCAGASRDERLVRKCGGLSPAGVGVGIIPVPTSSVVCCEYYANDAKSWGVGTGNVVRGLVPRWGRGGEWHIGNRRTEDMGNKVVQAEQPIIGGQICPAREQEQIRFIHRWKAHSQSCVVNSGRKTGYKRVERFKLWGFRSRAPHTHPNSTASDREADQAHPTWGPKKLVAWLGRVEPWMRARQDRYWTVPGWWVDASAVDTAPWSEQQLRGYGRSISRVGFGRKMGSG